MQRAGLYGSDLRGWPLVFSVDTILAPSLSGGNFNGAMMNSPPPQVVSPLTQSRDDKTLWEAARRFAAAASSTCTAKPGRKHESITPWIQRCGARCH
ncbi:unnamed protein product [Urochloa humidicola]